MNENTAERQIYLVGGGIASLAAAAFLIRDSDILGQNITILEESNTLGGSLDGSGPLKKAMCCAAGGCSKARLFRKGRRQVAPPFGLSEQHIVTLERLALEPEFLLGRGSIAGQFDSALSGLPVLMNLPSDITYSPQLRIHRLWGAREGRYLCCDN